MLPTSPLATKLIIGMLSGSILTSLSLPLAFQAPPTTEKDFWIEAFRAFITIIVTFSAIMMGLVYKLWQKRIVNLETYTKDADKWFKKSDEDRVTMAVKIDKRQRLMVELLGVVAFGIKMDPKLEQQATQLLYELRRDDS